MRYITLITMLTLLFNGCAQKTLVMEKSQQERLRSKSITSIIKISPENPEVNTPGRALTSAVIGGALGVLVSSIGQDKADKIEIPANYISEKITSFIAEKYHMKIKNEQEKKKEESGVAMLTPKEDIPELDRLKSSYTSDYLLDVDTYIWAITYTKWNGGASYVVIVKNNLRLIERESKKIISSTSCEYLPQYKEGLPTYDEMFANNGEIIKKESRKASDLCIEKIKKELF